MRRMIMKQHVLVTFEGELVTFYEDEKSTYHLVRYTGGDEEGFYVHWRDEKGS